MPPFTFRPATPADLTAVIDLVTSAYRGESSRAGWTTEADFLEGNRIDSEILRDDMLRPRSRVILAEHTGNRQPIACAHIAEDDGAGYFGMFAVSPTLQGAGIGKALLAEAERVVFDEWQLPQMRMLVIDLRDELIAFYQRRGYRRTGRYTPFPYGDPRFGLPLRSDLRFETLEKSLSRAHE